MLKLSEYKLTYNSLFKEENNYCSISNNIVKKIVVQTSGYEEPKNIDAIDLFQEDVRIIAKEGKVYYFPHEVSQ